MNIYGNDGNLIFDEGNYEIIDTFNDVIEVKTKKNGIFRVKLSFCDGSDVKVLPNEISVVREEDSNTVDIDGKTYTFVTINGLDWLTENLSVVTTDSKVIVEKPEYGRFYSPTDFTNILSKVPSGWRLPDENDAKLLMNISDISTHGGADRAHALQMNDGVFTSATNETGFSAIAAGHFDKTSKISSYIWRAPDASSVNQEIILIENDDVYTSGWTKSVANTLWCSIRLCRTHV